MNRRATGRSGSGRNESGRNQGFTLIEMMVVISVILILLGVAIPLYSHSITQAKEQSLRKNLETLNQMIFQYTQDKQKAPQSLNDLVAAKYLKSIPDDITDSSDTWETESGEDAIMSLDQTDAGGIIGVHSGSHQRAGDGTEYSTW
jgi:general secretion pathway protein G